MVSPQHLVLVVVAAFAHFEGFLALPATSLRLSSGKVYPHLVGGTPCQFDGKEYRSGDTIPRRHPCHNCVCARGSVECFWQNCPPPPEGCSEMTYKNICNPSMYNCPIPDAPSTNQTVPARTRRRFGSRRSNGGPVQADCLIRGIAYFTGETIGLASNNCLECRCAKNSMYCTPLCCYERAAPAEEDAERRYRSVSGRRPIDPNPLAHVEGLGMQPSGSL